MLLYHFPLTSSSATATIVNKGLKNDYIISGDNNFSSGGKLSAYAKDMGENKFYLSIPNFSLDYTLCFRAKAASNILLLSVGYTPFEITADNTWHDYVICDKKVYKDGLFLTNYNYSAGIVAFGNSEDSCQGLIQDIRIYDYALSQAEINEYSRALVVHYPLQGNELNSSMLKDVSGFGNEYILQGTNSYQLDSARGVKSLHTTDTAIYTQIPISSGYTTSFWCKYNGEWKHLCNNGSKYVNGVVNSSLYDTIYATLTASGYDIVDYRVYATALSSEDIKNLYNSPIAVSKQHQTMAFEFKENPLYPSKYWRTPTYAEMNYILNTRTNAANLRTLGRVEISSGTYRNGLLLLPDGFIAPSGVSVTITTAGFVSNTYSLSQLKQLESVGVVFVACNGFRNGTEAYDPDTIVRYYLGTNAVNPNQAYQLAALANTIECNTQGKAIGRAVRLVHNGTKFSISATTKIDFAPANLQYHCTQHIWRFAEHSYDIIGAANANISDSYNGWIDLFGYGTSGVNYSPTLHSTNNSDYASGNIANTDNDWGINEIQSYDYNVKNFALNKNGLVQHNELRENDSDVNGCYNDKLITNELIEQ